MKLFAIKAVVWEKNEDKEEIYYMVAAGESYSEVVSTMFEENIVADGEDATSALISFEVTEIENFTTMSAAAFRELA